MSLRRSLALFSVAAAVLAAALATRAVANDLDTPRDLHGVPHVTSSGCRRCHASHYASWRRTFHGKMTQEATASGALLGDFEAGRLTYLGVTATMDHDVRGAPRMTFTDATGVVVRRATVERTVGSRRYQQYLARDGDLLFRLPVAWSVEEGRFFPMNGAFLGADPPEPGANSRGIPPGYDRHITRWNDNCIFCHNVAPRPGWDESRRTFTTGVAELGVACEACHGPGDAHAAANANPLRRYALHLSDEPDPTIVNPRRLSGLRSAEICGRCHGQRLAPDVAVFLARGDTFVPGDDLSRYSAPLAADTPLRGDRAAFSDRFWADGTARLTAYEHQGYLASPCRADASFTCTSCHAMHDGDPRGQLRPDAIDDRACTQCHEELSTAQAAAAHSHHDARGEGVRCVECHMPRIVYGLVGAHRSHRIEVPDPAASARDERPDACTLCHVGRTREWAIAAHARLFPTVARGERDLVQLPHDPARDGALPESARSIAGGDPIARAIAADALGRAPSFADGPEGSRERRLARLLDAMAHDRFPAVRRVAARSAARLAPDGSRSALAAYEATASTQLRAAAVSRIQALLPYGARALRGEDSAIAAVLRESAPGHDIVIGE